MTHEDMEKARKIWQSMNEAGGENKPFPSEQIASAMEMAMQSMAEEDPESLVLCSCHGQYWPSKDVDMWGLCPCGR